MLVKFLEMTCDAGGCSAEHFAGCSREEAEDMARYNGWIVVNGKHFCSEACQERYRATKKLERQAAKTLETKER